MHSFSGAAPRQARSRLLTIILLVSSMLLLSHSAAWRAAQAVTTSPIRLEYRTDVEQDASDIDPVLRITNISDQPLYYSDLAIRYWYTTDSYEPEMTECSASHSNTAVMMNCQGWVDDTYNPVPGADRVLEVSLRADYGSDDYDLSPGESVVLSPRVIRADTYNPAPYNEQDDYSWDGTKTGFTEWDRVAVYQQDQLIWGVEPAGAVMPRVDGPGQITLQYQTDLKNDSSNVNPRLRINNIGGEPISLSDIKLRYWYTIDSYKPEMAGCGASYPDPRVYSRVDCYAGVDDTYNPAEGADRVAEVWLNGADGKYNLEPGESIDIYLEVERADTYSPAPYNEQDDYSWDGTKTRLADWDRVAVYQQDQLVWGVEPAGAVMPRVEGPGQITLQYQTDLENDSSNVNPRLRINNIGGEPISLWTIKLRYWYTIDSYKPEMAGCGASYPDPRVYSRVDCYAQSVDTYNPASGADRVVEVWLNGADGKYNLEPGESIDIYLEVERADTYSPAPYNEQDDYSWDGTKTRLADWDRVAVYQQDQLVWGVEPAGAVMPRVDGPGQITLQYQTDLENDSSNVNPRLRINNIGETAILFADIKLRYWYSMDVDEPETTECDAHYPDTRYYAPVACDARVDDNAYPTAGADRVLEVTLSAEKPELEPGESVLIYPRALRASTDGGSPYNEEDDYSWDGTKTRLADWDRVAVYVQGQLMWGVVPEGYMPPTSTPTSTPTPTNTPTPTSTPTPTNTPTPTSTPTPTNTPTPTSTPTPTPLVDPRMLEWNIKINFQPADAAPYAGYLVDGGEIYGPRAEGLSYGWNSQQHRVRDMNELHSPDQRYDTHAYVDQQRFWELELPNGVYDVHVVAGTGSVDSSKPWQLDVEDVRAIDQPPTSGKLWLMNTVRVSVSDGKLTLQEGPNAAGVPLCFVKVRVVDQ